jgi:predicted Zn-dependent protease
MKTFSLRNILSLAAVAPAAILLTACAINPVSGERDFVMMSEDQEIAMGAEGARSVAATIGEVDDSGLQQYVQTLGQRMAVDSERPDLPWTFRVLDDPTPNAFAFPGGYIFITRGLVGLMGNEAELVSVLGHEIGHVTARHSVIMMSRAQAAQIGLGIGSMISPELAQFSDVLAGGLSLLFLSYGRDAERQADDLGFGYALDHGYDVREMVNVFAALQRAGDLAGHSPLPEWAASHPEPAERIQLIETKLAALDQSLERSRVGTDEYLGHIDGMIFGVNPRHGFFEDHRFKHPDMAFQLDFPRDWRTQNLAQMVVAGSPDQDAVIQLDLAEGAPDAAARQFFGQQGLTGSDQSRRSINGLDAMVGRFQAQTQGGEISGRAAFISHGGQTFRLLAYTESSLLRRHDPAFQATLSSFARLTDRQDLARQPDRIVIERPNQTMTLSTFNARYPSVIDIEQLALINHLSGPNARIAAGTPIKRVISQ